VGSLAQIDQFVGLVFWSQIKSLEPDSACEMSVRTIVKTNAFGEKLSFYRLLCGRACRIVAV